MAGTRRTANPPSSGAAIGIALLAFVAYIVTLYPSVAGGDSGELIVAAHTLGSAHPTGYPLFVLLGRTFTLIPVESIAWRVNLVSALCEAGAVFFLSSTVSTFTRSASASVAAGALFAFSPTVWNYATTAEVFALNNLIVSLQLYLAARAWTSRDRRFVYAAAFVVGLGAANHATSIVTGSLILAALLWSFRPWTPPALAGIAAAVMGGLLPYIFLPIASGSATPSPAQWGDQTTVSGFLTHVLRREYGTLRLAGPGYEGRIDTVDQLGYYVADAVRQLTWIGAALAIVGVYRGVRDKALRPATALSICCWAAYLLFFHSFANLPIDQPLFHGIVSRFWQQPFLFVCAWAGLGLAAVAGSAGWLAPAAAALVVAGPLALNAAASNHRHAWTIHDYGAEVLRPLPAQALVLTHGDLILNASRYVQDAEHVRPDLRIVDQEMLTFRWMKPLLAKRMPEIALPGAYYHVRDSGTFDLKQLVDANIGSRPVVVCGGAKEGDSSLDAAYDQWPLGFCSELRAKSAPMDLDAWLRRSEAALPTLRGDEARDAADSWERVAWKDFWEARHRRGLWLLTQAIVRNDPMLYPRSAAIFDDLIAHNPSPPPYYYKNSGIAYARAAAGRPDLARKAIEAWTMYLRVAPPEDREAPAIRTAIAELQQGIR